MAWPALPRKLGRSKGGRYTSDKNGFFSALREDFEAQSTAHCRFVTNCSYLAIINQYR